MAVSAKRGKLVLRNMENALSCLAEDQRPETVHRFRTTTRRLEILLEQFTRGRDRNQKKLLKMLGKIRKRAGKLRDIDMQIAALRSFKIPQEPRRKTQLMQRLIELRLQYEKKLSRQLKKKLIRELKNRLHRASESLDMDRKQNPLAVAREILSSPALSSQSAAEELLHLHRIAVKRARYAAELADKSSAVTRYIAELKRLQDALGNWHDWLTLTQAATDELGEVSQSSLVAALHNVTRGKFRHALAALSSSRDSRSIQSRYMSKGARATPDISSRAGAKRPSSSENARAA